MGQERRLRGSNGLLSHYSDFGLFKNIADSGPRSLLNIQFPITLTWPGLPKRGINKIVYSTLTVFKFAFKIFLKSPPSRRSLNPGHHCPLKIEISIFGR